MKRQFFNDSIAWTFIESTASKSVLHLNAKGTNTSRGNIRGPFIEILVRNDYFVAIHSNFNGPTFSDQSNEEQRRATSDSERNSHELIKCIFIGQTGA